MQKERLKYLLEIYFKNRISAPELQELENWYHHLNFGEEALNQWLHEVEGEDVIVNQLYEKFEQKIHQPVKIKTLSITRIVTLAATIILMLSSGIYFYQSYSIHFQKTAVQNIEAMVIKPGGNKAMLTLSNGRKVDLTTFENGQMIEAGGVRIKKNSDGQLQYEIISGSDFTTENNTISTPKGGQYKVILSDGTRVWLNSASSLKYPSFFAGKERKVELIGEAYFEVSHNKDLPFIVHSADQEVKVLGTHFNIKAYSNEPGIRTTLLEGSIMLGSVNNPANRKLLVPGQQATFDAGGITIQDADVKEVMAWKNGYFMFKDEDIYSIMNQISRWYDVEIVYAEKFENKRFGGYVSKSKKITELLNIMESTKGIRFKIDGRRVIVMR